MSYIWTADKDVNESDPCSNVNNNIINSNNIIKVQTKISIHWKIIINNGENSIAITCYLLKKFKFLMISTPILITD